MARSRFQLRLVRGRLGSAQEERSGGLAAVSRPTGHGDALVWRLLGTNNRELGRSAELFGSVDACLSAIGQLRRMLEVPPPARISFVDGHPSGFAWRWTIEAEGVSAATAARTFSRQRECRANFDIFVASAPHAEIVSALKGDEVLHLDLDPTSDAVNRPPLAQRRSVL